MSTREPHLLQLLLQESTRQPKPCRNRVHEGSNASRNRSFRIDVHLRETSVFEEGLVFLARCYARDPSTYNNVVEPRGNNTSDPIEGYPFPLKKPTKDHPYSHFRRNLHWDPYHRFPMGTKVSNQRSSFHFSRCERAFCFERSDGILSRFQSIGTSSFVPSEVGTKEDKPTKAS